jgi:hypothetical protein
MTRQRMTRVVCALAISAAAAATMPAAAAAEERTCRGTIGARTLDNVRVPQGAECVLKQTHLKGTVKVERRAILRAYEVRVVGNVQGENAREVNVLRQSRIGGSVQVVQGGAATVRQSRINGNILYDENRGLVRAVESRVGADLQVFQNMGGARIYRNVVDANLQCKENQPRPTGGENRVSGSKEDQCARL